VTSAPNWIELEGSVNARDVGGMPTMDGRRIKRGVLLRSANLQHLTEADVRQLVGRLNVRRIVDLRTDVEVDTTGPSPVHNVPDVTIHHLSLYPDARPSLDPDAPAAEPVIVPWHAEKFVTARGPIVSSYLRYLERRPDSIVAALRAIAEPEGATLVHCAAGKDRTGVVVALALAVAGASRAAIAADYAVTESQLGAIIAHLAKSELYSREVNAPETVPRPTAEVMLAVLDGVDEDFGGVLAWLADHGWTDGDTERLRTKLLA